MRPIKRKRSTMERMAHFALAAVVFVLVVHSIIQYFRLHH